MAPRVVAHNAAPFAQQGHERVPGPRVQWRPVNEHQDRTCTVLPDSGSVSRIKIDQRIALSRLVHASLHSPSTRGTVGAHRARRTDQDRRSTVLLLVSGRFWLLDPGAPGGGRNLPLKGSRGSGLRDALTSKNVACGRCLRTTLARIRRHNAREDLSLLPR